MKCESVTCVVLETLGSDFVCEAFNNWTLLVREPMQTTALF